MFNKYCPLKGRVVSFYSLPYNFIITINERVMVGELLSHLNQVSDPRRRAGMRHPVGVVLLLSIMAAISGLCGYRAIGDFVKANQQELCGMLGVKRLPSFSTVRRVLMGLSVGELSLALCRWRSPEMAQKAWVQVDGKALKGTVKDYSEGNQDFVSVVSLFFGQQKAVLAADSFHNKQKSEIHIVQELIAGSGLQGVIFTADAMHAQKNDTKHCGLQVPLRDKSEGQPAPSAAAG